MLIDVDEWKIDISGSASTSLNESIIRLVNTPFELESQAMLRAHLIPAGRDKNVLIVVIHHLACDGWSIEIIIREWTAIYASTTAGQNIELPQQTATYADFCEWQRNHFQDEKLQTT